LVIAFDSWVFRNSHHNSGIYNYAKNILVEFGTLVAANDELTIRSFFTQGYSDEMLDLALPAGIETLKTRLLRFHRLWQLGGLAAASARARADLIFAPTSRTCPFGPIPLITTIHDVTPVVSRSFGSSQNLLERIRLWNAAKFSVKCLTDSERSKKDLIELYGLPAEKVKVVYLGYDRGTFNSSPADSGRQKVVFDRHGITGPYIFHHGTVQPRKNLERLIRAFQHLWESRRDFDFQLVLAGPLGWRYDSVIELATKAGRRVVLTGVLCDEDLALLLKGAALSVIPSLYEGFCLPMVEAMACGVPTIASDTSCLPEISGGVLRYFDPLSIEAIAITIRAVLEDRSLQQQLVERGVKRASEFSWERCARETLSALLCCNVRRNGSQGMHPRLQ
jgi:glycosyltransferase involved in cell wall biosynthesis